MRNKPRKASKEVQFSHLELSYHAGYERDWAKMLAGFLMQRIKEDLEKSGVSGRLKLI